MAVSPSLADSHRLSVKLAWIRGFILQSKPFWILARAVKEFVQEEGQGEEKYCILGTYCMYTCVALCGFTNLTRSTLTGKSGLSNMAT